MMPLTNEAAATCHAWMRSAHASEVRAAVKKKLALWAKKRSFHRCTLSAIAPPKGATTIEATPFTADTLPRASAESVSVRTSHPCTTISIHMEVDRRAEAAQ